MKIFPVTTTLSSLFLMLMFGATTQAAIVAVQTDVSTISPCPSFCGGSGGMSDFATDGGVGSTTASSSLVNSDGTGRAVGSLPGPIGLPELGAESFSGQDSRVSSSAMGMQRYLYSGAPTTLSLNMALDGTATIFEPDDQASIEGNVAVILGSDLFFTTHFPTLIYEVVDPGDVLGQSSLSLPDDGSPTTVTDSISFAVNQGDEFFVWANLVASGTRGGTADALNTLSLTFTDHTGLTPTGSAPAVPIPGTGLLLGSALAVAAWGRRKPKLVNPASRG